MPLLVNQYPGREGYDISSKRFVNLEEDMDMGLRFFEAIFENSVSTVFAVIISVVFFLAILAAASV